MADRMDQIFSCSHNRSTHGRVRKGFDNVYSSSEIHIACKERLSWPPFRSKPPLGIIPVSAR